MCWIESVADRYVIDPTPQRFWPQFVAQTIPQARLIEYLLPMAKSVSLHLSFFVPKSSGDLIQAASTVRFAEEVAVYATTSGLADKTKIIVPNGQMMSDPIRNYGESEDRRLDLIIGKGYEDDTWNNGTANTRVMMFCNRQNNISLRSK